MKGGIGNAGFTCELLKSEVSALFTEVCGQLFRQSFLCHDWMLQPSTSHKWDILLYGVIGEA